MKNTETNRVEILAVSGTDDAVNIHLITKEGFLVRLVVNENKFTDSKDENETAVLLMEVLVRAKWAQRSVFYTLGSTGTKEIQQVCSVEPNTEVNEEEPEIIGLTDGSIVDQINEGLGTNDAMKWIYSLDFGKLGVNQTRELLCMVLVQLAYKDKSLAELDKDEVAYLGTNEGKTATAKHIIKWMESGRKQWEAREEFLTNVKKGIRDPVHATKVDVTKLMNKVSTQKQVKKVETITNYPWDNKRILR